MFGAKSCAEDYSGATKQVHLRLIPAAQRILTAGSNQCAAEFKTNSCMRALLAASAENGGIDKHNALRLRSVCRRDN